MRNLKTGRKLKIFSRLSAIVLVMILAFPEVNGFAYADSDIETEVVSIETAKPKCITGRIYASDINEAGTIYLSIKCEDFISAGYNYGDIVKVKILGQKYKLPFLSDCSELDKGKAGLFACKDDTNLSLAINTGNFASKYGIAGKTDSESGNIDWKLANGANSVKVSIWLKKSCGYAGKRSLRKEGITEKYVPLVYEDGSTKSMKIRIYKDQPNIPYCGLKAYSDILGTNTITSENDRSGNIIFTSSQGIKAIADITAGTLSTDNWAGFHNPKVPKEGCANYLGDSGCDFIRISEIKYEGTSAPITFDFKKYRMNMYADTNDVYLPLSIVSNLMTDIATRHIKWNGEKVFYSTFLSSEDYQMSAVVSSPLIHNIFDEGIRPKDVVDETYNELCFGFDYFYGHPGVNALDQAIEEKGLESALLDLGEKGRSLINRLKSENTLEYYSALDELFMCYLNDNGHTFLLDYYMCLQKSVYNTLSDEEQAQYNEMLINSNYVSMVNIYDDICATRDAVWGDDIYREYGNTAIIRLLDFNPDIPGWQKYYQDQGEMPMDSVGITYSCLKKASENPKIKNVLFDLSVNVGGSSDVLSFITIITTGKNTLYGLDHINNQYFTVYYEADTNLDGIIDEKDMDDIYDQFNYGVLTSKQAFSCGNLFPFMMQEAGAVLIGEPTGGGSCTIEVAVQPDATVYIISSSQWQLVDSNRISVESGCKTDLPIAHKETIVNKNGYEIVKFDYSSYFNVKKLNKMMNDWFAKQEKEAA